MIRLLERRPPRKRSAAAPKSLLLPPAGEPAVEVPPAYGTHFWLAYVSNLLVMIGVALFYRYADFVHVLGGTEWELGWIVGVGMVGSLAARLSIGSGIDRHGSRLIWLGALGLFTAVCILHVPISNCTSVPIYAVRLAYCCAVAGIVGGSMTFISARAPAGRLAEMLGMLGTSGFLGNTLGTGLGDLLAGGSPGRMEVNSMFLVAGGLGLAAAIFAALATRGELRPVHDVAPPFWSTLRRHLPLGALMVGVAMGIGLNLPYTFLRPYTVELGIPFVFAFFGTYSMTAFVTRIVTRRWADNWGPEPVILIGLSILILSELLLLPVGRAGRLLDATWLLMLPGAVFGVAHALLFPSVVAAGTRSFPRSHRGVAMTLILSTWDVGVLIGAPTGGAILALSRLAGWPPYPTLFVLTAMLIASVAAVFGVAVCARRRAGGA
ncbi:MAG: MFS transporter [Planctomycetota bacterium]